MIHFFTKPRWVDPHPPHRIVPIGEARLVTTLLSAASHLVRVHPREGEDYDRMIVVTEQEGGKALFLSGWVGKPLTPREWREAAAFLFPKARVVRFERRKDGRVRLVVIRLR
jgi:hypothetical protein